MSGYYVYLISSLPMLQFGTKPPFGKDRFLEICSQMIPAQDMEALKKALQGDLWKDEDDSGILKKRREFETALRNELVRIRALRKHIDPAKYLRTDGYAEQSISHVAAAAIRSPSIIDGQKILDLERWKFLDEISMSHYFDLELLMIYAMKLSILERWDVIKSADAGKLLEETITI